MPTKEQLDAIAKYIGNIHPDCNFLVLMTPIENPLGISICSNLPRNIQPLLAEAFVQGFKLLETGAAREINLTKPH